MFLSLLQQWRTDRLCVCVCVHKRIPEYSPPKTLQTMSVQVRERQPEGGREREEEMRKFDKDGKREERRRKDRFPYSAAVAMATRPTIHTASATVAKRIRNELTPPLNFPSQENTLAMSKPRWPPPPLFCFQLGESLFTPSPLELKPDEQCLIRNKSSVAHDLKSVSQERHS